MTIIEVLIGDIAAPVDEQEWADDKDAVIADVLHNREALRLTGQDTSAEADRIITEQALS